MDAVIAAAEAKAEEAAENALEDLGLAASDMSALKEALGYTAGTWSKPME